VHTRAAARLARLMPEKVEPDMSMYLLSPMPGLLRSVAVSRARARRRVRSCAWSRR
jgi:propionyl-CoA carboxylase alpha chain